MLKYFFIIFSVYLLYLCSCSKQIISDSERTCYDTLYRVNKIKKINDWYLIYLQRNDSIFKVVTHEPSDKTRFEGRCKIKKHGRYDMIIKAYRDTHTWNGLNIWPIGYTGGFNLDSITIVSVEPENGIWDIYNTDDLQGLYYMR